MINFPLEIKNKGCVEAAYDNVKSAIKIALENIQWSSEIEKSVLDLLLRIVESKEIFLFEYQELETLCCEFNNKKLEKSFLEEIKKAFNYKKFREKHGVTIAQNFPCKTCYYCNGQLIGINMKSGSLILQFDHFFPQDVYPYLAISYYNLIPSCASCNQRKSAYDPLNPKIKIFINSPYDHKSTCIDEAIGFEFDDVSLINRYIGKEEDITFGHKRNHGCAASEEEILAYFERFKIKDLYNFHAANLNDLVDIFIKYRYSGRKNGLPICKTNPLFRMFGDMHEIFRFWVGVDIKNRNILHKPMGKITKELGGKLFKDFEHLDII